MDTNHYSPREKPSGCATTTNGDAAANCFYYAEAGWIDYTYNYLAN